MLAGVSGAINKMLGSFGVEIRRKHLLSIAEADADHVRIMDEVKPYTLTSRERIWSLMNAIDYISVRDIDGSVVECGVWRGGSMMAAAKRLLVHRSERQLYLFDTFEGMSEPTGYDSAAGHNVKEEWLSNKVGDHNNWCYADIDDVRTNVLSTGYKEDKISFIKGKVEETLAVPTNLPDSIALLRLDTDWYESTKAELEILYPRLVVGGVLIIDDYGYWDGARRAVDEYFEDPSRRLLLNYIDGTGRIAVKV